MRDLSAAYPSEGTTAEVVVSGAGRAAGRRGRSAGRARGGRRGDRPVPVDRRAGRGLGGRPDLGAHPGHPVRRVRRPRGLRGPGAARRPGAAGPGRLDVAYAVGGDAAESLDFVDRQQERLPLVIGFVLLLTLLIMARDVPQRADRDRLRRAQPGLGRGGVRDDGAGVPARLVRERARLHQPGLRDRLDPAVRARGAGRAVDGLPRLRAQPGA